MRNVAQEISFLVVILETSAAARGAWAAEPAKMADQATPDADADGSTKPVALDVGTDQPRALHSGISDSASVVAGLADIGDSGARADAGPGTDVLPNSIPQPLTLVTAENRESTPEQNSHPAFVEAPSNESDSAPVVPVRAAPVASNRLPMLGLMADLGVPDGLIGSLAVRPWSWLRVSGGGGTNSISHGWRAGVTLLPFGSGPSASLEYGRYQDGDANGLAKKFMGSSFDGSPALDRVGYEYTNAHVGLDFGFRNVVFFLHGGVTMLRGTVHNLDAATRATGATDTTEVVVRQDPSFKAVGPSFKLGLIVYVW